MAIDFPDFLVLPYLMPEPGSPTNNSSKHFVQTRVSLFRSLFSLESLPLLRPKGARKAEGILAPQPKASPVPPFAPPSPTTRYTTIPPPPRSPSLGKTRDADRLLSPSSSFTLSNPPGRSPMRRHTSNATESLGLGIGSPAPPTVISFNDVKIDKND
ncbi:hypothetical protein H0H92_009660 [Tricholoma furcatifolium]|nr:hypothetical protein H0H92_009660 [Tricholoma furcatifolium]